MKVPCFVDGRGFEEGFVHGSALFHGRVGDFGGVVHEIRLFHGWRECFGVFVHGSAVFRGWERGYSRRTLSDRTGIPAPTLERFERTGKISLEAFCTLVVEFDYFQEMSEILARPKCSTGDELEVIRKNKFRVKGR